MPAVRTAGSHASKRDQPLGRLPFEGGVAICDTLTVRMAMFLAQTMLVLYAAPLSFYDALYQSFGSVFPIMAVAFAASAGITALMYMVGNALQMPEVLAGAKDNLANLIFSGILVLMFFVLFGIFSTLASSIACGYSCDHVQAAYHSVLLLRTKLFSLYSTLYFYELIFGFLSTIGFQIPPVALDPASMLGFKISLPSLSFSPLAGLTPLSNAHTIIVEAVGSAFLMVLARQVLLEFTMKYMFLFFALGAGLRSFTFTRRTGSSILALAAVAYFVYPSAIMLTNYLIFQVYPPSNFAVVPTAVGYCENQEDLSELSTKFVSERQYLYEAEVPKSETKWYMFWNYLRDTGATVFKSLEMALKVMGAFNLRLLFSLVVSPLAFSSFFDFLIMEIQTYVQFLVVIFVAFFVEIIITITSYRAAAMLIEGETEIFGISKLM